METKNMKKKILKKTYFLGFLGILVLAFVIPCFAWAQGPPRITLETAAAQKLSLTVGKSVILGSSEPVKRVSLGTPEGIPEIAVAMVLTPRQIYLTGKNPGVTNLTVWGTNDKIVMDLEVSPDISRLKEMIQKIMPEEKNIQATATHDNITLSGTVSNMKVGATKDLFEMKMIFGCEGAVTPISIAQAGKVLGVDKSHKLSALFTIPLAPVHAAGRKAEIPSGLAVSPSLAISRSCTA